MPADAAPALFDLEVGTPAYPATASLQVEDSAWGEAVPDVPVLLTRAIRAALLGGDPAGLDLAEGTPLDLSVVLCDDARIQALNREWRDKDAPTNVLSFAALDAEEPLPPPGAVVLLGDVVIARETVLREALDQGIPVADHVFHLAVHGVLHLLGYDHQEDEEAVEMEGLETAILAEHGIQDPHAALDGVGS
ncbi:rRNA maturation RNase YbeY [Pararhodospirillum photometricum]|nr:rRNA maturation RNase YbeY [Pararhodospirillum photometricum]